MFKLIAVCAALLPAAALAQAPPNPVGITGAVVSIAEDSVTLKTKDGATVTVAMTPGWDFATPRAASAQDIKPGDFVASINMNLGADSGRATEARLFEAGYRPESGTHAMPQPNTSITHGTVAASTRSPAGQELEVIYLAGSRHIIVPADVKVTAFDLHDRSAVKPGMMVTALTRKDPDGVARAERLTPGG